MKKILLALAAVACIAVATPCYGAGKIVKGDSKTIDSLSYSMGVMIGVTILEQNSLPIADMKIADLNKGVEDYLLKRAKISPEEAEKANNAIFEEVYNRAVGALSKGNDKAVEASLKFTAGESKKISYNVGVLLGGYILEGFKTDFPNVTIQYYWLCKAIEDVCVKNNPQLTLKQVEEVIVRYDEAIAPSQPQQPAAVEEVKVDTLSYFVGVVYANTFMEEYPGVKFNLEIFYTALNDVATHSEKMAAEDAAAVFDEFLGKVLPARLEAHKEALKQNPNAVFNAFADQAECDKVSYVLGLDAGYNLLYAMRLKFDVNFRWFMQGFYEAMNDAITMNPDQAMAYMQNYITLIPAKMAAQSAKWLAEKEQESGVKKCESGLLYKIVEQGDMTRAAKSDEAVVKVHYVGRHQSGVVFDTSRFEEYLKPQQIQIRRERPQLFDKDGNYINKEPIEFPLNAVIKGWTEGMKLIGPGGKIVLYVPAELAYGAEGSGSSIVPNEALMFEVELLDVKN